jgi:hypothetical protein
MVPLVSGEHDTCVQPRWRPRGKGSVTAGSGLPRGDDRQGHARCGRADDRCTPPASTRSADCWATAWSPAASAATGSGIRLPSTPPSALICLIANLSPWICGGPRNASWPVSGSTYPTFRVPSPMSFGGAAAFHARAGQPGWTEAQRLASLVRQHQLPSGLVGFPVVGGWERVVPGDCCCDPCCASAPWVLRSVSRCGLVLVWAVVSQRCREPDGR